MIMFEMLDKMNDACTHAFTHVHMPPHNTHNTHRMLSELLC
jgi:hypothetical protein